MKVFGIDYSASQKPANKIWVAECSLVKSTINLNQVYNLKEKIEYDSIDACNLYLVNLVKNNINYFFGFDFSFSIPEIFFKNLSWEELIFIFSSRWISPEEFKNELLKNANGRELKRETEIQSKVPFSSYNLWIYKQTYHGITGIITPLLREKLCSFIPYSLPIKNRPSLMETCPASFLKSISIENDLSKYYKGKRSKQYENRIKILKLLEDNYNLRYTNNTLKDKIINNTDGDALDSVICCICVFRGIKKMDGILANSKFKKEGYVFY